MSEVLCRRRAEGGEWSQFMRRKFDSLDKSLTVPSSKALLQQATVPEELLLAAEKLPNQ